ncbi:MAG: molecular chaperone HtpG [Gammaproteobacteria bacterium]|jgi:molecular chaperone HtpG
MTTKTTHGFQTEVSQLMDLMIHSLYSNKEIFLRELISNASDACDKLRFESLSDESLLEGDSELRVEVLFDESARTVTVCDNGVGMNEAEAVDHLGTIAKSGTRQFFESLTGDSAADARLIGQFGVGFYSSFIVADKVSVTSRRAGEPSDQGVRWESTGKGEFTIESVDAPHHGTEVVLHLKEDEGEFADASRLRHIIKKYSDHVAFPIRMLSQVPTPVPADDEDEAAEGEAIVEAAVMETVNSATALWSRNRNEISDEEYQEFYKHVAHDYEAPLDWVHSRVEGRLEYTSLLYVPARAPFDLWDRQSRHGVNLYVRRVFIMDDAEQLMPTYLRFVRGVIDSSDLPLNVSREILQQSKDIDSIRAGSVKRVLDLIAGLAENDTEKFAQFWAQFGKVLKEGVVEDTKNKDTVASLLRFASTRGDGDAQNVSLADYVGRMRDGHERIFYVTADRFATALNSPHLEIFRDKNVEVLLLTDEIDEWVVSSLNEFDGHQFQSVAKGDPNLAGLDDPEAQNDGKQDGDSDEAKDDDQNALLERMKVALGERVRDVRISRRLTQSPACLVVDDHDMSGHLERILKAAGQTVPGGQPILEINPDHAMVRRFAAEKSEERALEWASVFFDQALLSEGGRLEDPAGFVSRMNSLFMADEQDQGELTSKPASKAKAKAKPKSKAKPNKPKPEAKTAGNDDD